MKNININKGALLCKTSLPKRNTVQKATIIKGSSILNKYYHKRIEHYLKGVPVICRGDYP